MPTPPGAPKRPPPRLRAQPTALLALAAAACAGCSTPFRTTETQDLQNSLVQSVLRELEEAREFDEMLTTARAATVDSLQLRPEHMPQLESMAGPLAHDPSALDFGADLLGQPQRSVRLSLRDVIATGVERNLAVRFARLQPAIREADVVAAEAAFDWSFFSNVDSSYINQPQVNTSGFGATPEDERYRYSGSFGLRKAMPTGGQFAVQQEWIYTDVHAGSPDPNPAVQSAFTVQLDQPLLRGFGSDVALSQIRLNRNAERDAIAVLKSDVMDTVGSIEQAYWQLWQAERNALIVRALLDRGIVTRDEVRGRRIREATAAQEADAVARVWSRRAALMQAMNQVRQTSDQLKSLINDPNLPVGSEVLLLTTDAPVDAPVQFSLVESVTTGLRQRPEIQQAILSLDNTSLRQTVADNSRLPRLDLRLQARYSGLDDDFGNATEDVADGSFLTWLVGLAFEQPLGNRAGEAEYRKRVLESASAGIAYRNIVQQVVLEVKSALRTMLLNYDLVGAQRVNRFSASERLRAFMVEKDLSAINTVERLNLEFQNQELLAGAEQDEVAALASYNVALARLHVAMGTILERNRIDFVVPNVEGREPDWLDREMRSGATPYEAQPEVDPIDRP
jgi:outer membrane protein